MQLGRGLLRRFRVHRRPVLGGFQYSFIYESDDPQTQAYYQEYLDLVETALSITDDDEARYETFAQAEAVLLDHAFAIPIHTNDRVYTFGKLNVFEGPYAAFGFSTLRYKGQHVMETSMGMENLKRLTRTWLTEREEALAAARRISGRGFQPDKPPGAPRRPKPRRPADRRRQAALPLAGAPLPPACR